MRCEGNSLYSQQLGPEAAVTEKMDPEKTEKTEEKEKEKMGKTEFSQNSIIGIAIINKILSGERKGFVQKAEFATLSLENAKKS